ncbi:hypothetical protein [Aureimonas sp. AU40]|uniref:hypothetical protein n=1 Tax=Aureimonas sp. AU40 TaxID=1637747 RepID=UPI000780CDBB|nr:hypothetical protein [Aureimonas sp. AU40]
MSDGTETKAPRKAKAPAKPKDEAAAVEAEAVEDDYVAPRSRARIARADASVQAIRKKMSISDQGGEGLVLTPELKLTM